jgi:hypothetical protein
VKFGIGAESHAALCGVGVVSETNYAVALVLAFSNATKNYVSSSEFAQGMYGTLVLE